MLENVFLNGYSNILHSYNSLNVSSNIIGTVVDNSENKVTLKVKSEMLELELKHEVIFKKGETVSIDKSNIISSKLKCKESFSKTDKEDAKYTDILNQLRMTTSFENLRAVKTLEKYNMDISEESIKSFLIAKESLEKIESNLDYDIALEMFRNSSDLESKPVDRVAEEVLKVKSEKKGLELLKSSEMLELTTEEAEKIAVEIYGGKVGKDIIDIIKCLHLSGVSINKNNIEKINEIFYKLDKLKYIEDEIFINTIKNGLDINIENLYTVSRVSREMQVCPSVEIQNLNLNKEGFSTYENLSLLQSSELSEAELIKELPLILEKLKLEDNIENRNMVLEFVKNGIELTIKNVTLLNNIKAELKTLSKEMSAYTASQLIKKNVDINTEDIRILTEKIDSLSSEKSISHIKEIDSKEILRLIREKEDFKISELRYLFDRDSKDFISNDESEVQAFKSIETMNRAFNKVPVLDLSTLSRQFQLKAPITLSSVCNLSLDYKEINSIYYDEPKEMSDYEIVKAKAVIECYENLKHNLTSKIVYKSISEKISLENIDIISASQYVNEYKKNLRQFKESAEEKAKIMINDFKSLKDTDKAIVLLMKNEKPISMTEIRKTQDSIFNKRQVGHDIAKLIKSDEAGSSLDKNLIVQLKEKVSNLTKSFKSSNKAIEGSYEELEQTVAKIESTGFDNSGKSISAKASDIAHKLEENKSGMQSNRIIQFPILIDGNITNLNMYFKDKSEESLIREKEEFSAVISLETKHLGYVQIVLKLQDKSVYTKVGLSNLKHIDRIKENSHRLIESATSKGYVFEEIKFYESEKDNAFDDEILSEIDFFSSSNKINLTV